ncbi:UTP--glucose-1-phosphate uridylyltransferase [Candidatus Berkelbacteria bacterium CG08_land_8_20_14_0_20_39_8]|uniref:UTP--glucose-1-phosphate uridylyltransferase n=1 Tax=Candidatus Berkelbacteria bacterium CG08_land_8_20_14_0_20_39_8 TaxID=1974511 RepID=A0A2M6YCH1_9BACT|nr:MAG: UTP--glucose-1-phosphate uridylyltransferase [Candidatus Berkelbacteria bacterium CG08_land_8_20_14_0_20_39_8]
MQKIRKAVIPAAGYGTRFLPITKSIPKEMLPLIDKPIIQYIIEEAVNSGIEDIVIVTSNGKHAIEDHFDNNLELERYLEAGGKLDQLEEIRRIASMANFIYIRQKGKYGNGTPVLNAEHIIGNEPFAVLWGDEFIAGNPPRLQQTAEVFEEFGRPVISGVRIKKKEDLSRYGIADLKPVRDNIFEIKNIVEKPKPEEAPSDLAAHGCYILTPDIFDALKNQSPGKGGEIWLVDGINKLKEKGPIYTCEIKEGKYYDCGNVLEYLKTNIDHALKREDIGDEIKQYLQETVKNF